MCTKHVYEMILLVRRDGQDEWILEREVIRTLGKSCIGAAQTEQFSRSPAAMSAVFLARYGDVKYSVNDWYHEVSTMTFHAAMTSKQAINRSNEKKPMKPGGIVPLTHENGENIFRRESEMKGESKNSTRARV